MNEEVIAVFVFRVADIKHAARLYSDLVSYTGCRSHIRDEHWDAGLTFYVSTVGISSNEQLYDLFAEKYGVNIHTRVGASRVRDIPRWILGWQLKKD